MACQVLTLFVAMTEKKYESHGNDPNTFNVWVGGGGGKICVTRKVVTLTMQMMVKELLIKEVVKYKRENDKTSIMWYAFHYWHEVSWKISSKKTASDHQIHISNIIELLIKEFHNLTGIGHHEFSMPSRSTRLIQHFGWNLLQSFTLHLPSSNPWFLPLKLRFHMFFSCLYKGGSRVNKVFINFGWGCGSVTEVFGMASLSFGNMLSWIQKNLIKNKNMVIYASKGSS
ncbi:hypothetical protein ACJX0J_041259, partial [Zea mays]